ncbi:MAG: Ig-like domain-containing protein [Candidatus Eremiobacteraeota bacterium]|nr:Ig-like domain-containing protein [Candidatus Eremiobacteraeota bacterium]
MKKFPVVVIIILIAITILTLTADSASYRIRIIKGNNQAIQVGKPAKDPIVLKVVDSRGMPTRALVKLKILKGELKLSTKSIKTDSRGIAKIYLNAGVVPVKTVIKAYIHKMPGTGVKLTYNITLDKPGRKQPGKKVAKRPVVKPIKKPTPKKTPVAKPIKKPTPKKTPAIKPIKKPTPKKTPVALKTPGKPGEAIPSVIIGFGGSNQKVLLNKTAKEELSVQIMDDKGNVMKGVTVEFKVIEGEAVVNPKKSDTDSKGIASTKIKMRKKIGMITVKAMVEENKGLSTVFNLKAVKKVAISTVKKPVARHSPVVVPSPAYTPTTPATPTTPKYTPSSVPDTIKLPPRHTTRPRGAYSREASGISVVAGNYQSSPPGVRLSQPVVVYITDADGNPTFATVTFTIMTGKATIINREVKTDARGLASTFVVVNSPETVKIVAEVLEKPGLSTIAYANMKKKEPKAENRTRTPIIRATTNSNTPGYPASIAFYDLRARKYDNIEKTNVIQLEIGVSDFRNAPVSTAVKFSTLKGKAKILTPIVQTDSRGKGICYVDVTQSMGIFTVEAQSMENPDLRAIFKSGPEIRTAPAPKVVQPGTRKPDTRGMKVPPPSSELGEAGKPALIAVIDGGGQKVKTRSKLPRPLVVLVTDSRGNPVKGITISFFMQTGRAVIHSPYARTNSQGKAKTHITLGKKPGIYEIGVRTKGKGGLSTSIRVEAVK